MAWIESHQELERHPKTLDLMSRMAWDLDTTLGKLQRFWWWCLNYAPTGDLRKHNDAILAGSVGLAPSDGTRFVAAMVESCWIDRTDGVFRVHDWPHYAGQYLRTSKFKREPARWLETLKLYEDRVSRDSHGTVTGLSGQPTYQPTYPPTNGGGKLGGLEERRLKMLKEARK